MAHHPASGQMVSFIASAGGPLRHRAIGLVACATSVHCSSRRKEPQGKRGSAMKDETQQTRSNGQQQPRQPVDRKALLESISKEQALLARLDREQADARTRLAALHAELSSMDAKPEIRVHLPLTRETPTPRTSAEKVKLFRAEWIEAFRR